MSVTRKKYIGRLIFRIIVLILCFIRVVCKPDSFDMLNGMNFFTSPDILHVLWIIWMLDMILKFFPTKGILALGALKHLRGKDVPSRI